MLLIIVTKCAQLFGGRKGHWLRKRLCQCCVKEKIMPDMGNAEGEIGHVLHEKRIALPNEHSANLEGKTKYAVGNIPS